MSDRMLFDPSAPLAPSAPTAIAAGTLTLTLEQARRVLGHLGHLDLDPVHEGTTWASLLLHVFASNRPAPGLWLMGSVLASLGAVAMMSRRHPLAALLLATAPIQVHYAAEVNNYPLVALASAAVWLERERVADGAPPWRMALVCGRRWRTSASASPSAATRSWPREARPSPRTCAPRRRRLRRGALATASPVAPSSRPARRCCAWPARVSA